MLYKGIVPSINMQHPCSPTSKKLCRNESCTICLEKSFASHPRAKFWCQEKNVVDPRQVFKKSKKKYWFKCGECNHVFEARLDNISNDHWCPYCSGKILCEDNTCETCYEKSFASHPKAKYWCQEKNIVNPRQLFKCSNKKYWFKCGECNHPSNAINVHVVVCGEHTESCVHTASPKITTNYTSKPRSIK
jgi:DNA-directed RNA polymerase subunit RPC12/RpoP